MALRTFRTSALGPLAGSLLAALVALVANDAHAEAPTMNWGNALVVRLDHNTRSVSTGPNVPQSKLVLDVLLDTDNAGPYVLSLEQGGRVLATGSCRSEEVVYSGTLVEGQRFLRDCATSWIDTATIRPDRPVDVALAYVDEASDERTVLYRGSFPTVTYYEWSGSYPLERRQLRLDSFFGVGFLRETDESRLQFMYVTTHDGEQRHDQGLLRCRVNEGAWVGYEIRSNGSGNTVAVRNAPEGNTIAEQSYVTEWVSFDARLPVVVPGRGRRPERGSELDGAWTCEFRTGGAGRAVTQREFRFSVVRGFIESHPIQAAVPVGRGVALTTIGLSPTAMPRIVDPALVRGAVGGRTIADASLAPTVANLPARATNPTLSAPPGASGGRGRPRR